MKINRFYTFHIKVNDTNNNKWKSFQFLTEFHRRSKDAAYRPTKYSGVVEVVVGNMSANLSAPPFIDVLR
jgi:hypothetical protein